jgi:hypothetical protein
MTPGKQQIWLEELRKNADSSGENVLIQFCTTHIG